MAGGTKCRVHNPLGSKFLAVPSRLWGLGSGASRESRHSSMVQHKQKRKHASTPNADNPGMVMVIVMVMVMVVHYNSAALSN